MQLAVDDVFVILSEYPQGKDVGETLGLVPAACRDAALFVLFPLITWRNRVVF